MSELENKSLSIWPNFFIVGAPKAGTTSLYHYLTQHPDIFLPKTKEPHYFCPDMAEALQIEHVRSEQEYLKLFESANATQLLGEASSGYLRAPEAPQRIKQKSPAAKIIILLREPGERAFSHYLMRWRSGGFQFSFSEGLANYGQHKRQFHIFEQAVLEPGFYGAQVSRYIEHFGHEQVKLIVAEDFFTNPKAMVKEVLAYLGVSEELEVDEFKPHNDYLEPRGKLSLLFLRHKRHLRFLRRWIPAQLKWNIVRKYFNKPAEKPALTPAQRQQLNAVYAEDIRQLRRIMNRPELWSGTVPAGYTS
jgi:hypothetical protein